MKVSTVAPRSTVRTLTEIDTGTLVISMYVLTLEGPDGHRGKRVRVHTARCWADEVEAKFAEFVAANGKLQYLLEAYYLPAPMTIARTGNKYLGM